MSTSAQIAITGQARRWCDSVGSRKARTRSPSDSDCGLVWELDNSASRRADLPGRSITADTRTRGQEPYKGIVAEASRETIRDLLSRTSVIRAALQKFIRKPGS